MRMSLRGHTLYMTEETKQLLCSEYAAIERLLHEGLAALRFLFFGA